MKTYELLITDDIFLALRDDFNDMLKKTILSMQKRESDSGKINLELKILLIKKSPGLSDERKKAYINLNFRHKVTSSIQIKDEVSGEINGEYELISDNGSYYIREADDSQCSLFDNE